MWFLLPALASLQHGSSLTFGTDPTEALTRFEIGYVHADQREGSVLDQATGRFDLGFGERVALRFDLPFAHAAPEDGQDRTGLGDVRAQIGWRAYSDADFSIFFGGGVVLDTAEDDALGTGQNQIVPMVAASGSLPEIRSHLYETIEHFVSFDGDPDRSGVALTKLDLHLMTEWSPTTWTQAGGEFFVDWKGGEHTGLDLDVEIGKSLGPRCAIWIRPGVGVFGDDVPGVVDWSIAAGVRWVF